MEMFLTIAAMSVFALAVCVAAFGAATRGQTPPGLRPEVRPEPRLAPEPPRFFAGPVVKTPPEPRVPLEVVLSQIERHVRLEQAAAEAFLDMPTSDSLRSPSSSPFLN